MMRRKNKKTTRSFARKRSDPAVTRTKKESPNTEKPPRKKARIARQTNNPLDDNDKDGVPETELQTAVSNRVSQSHRIPQEGTYPHRLWERLQPSSLLRASSPKSSPLLLVIQTMMRVRLVSGNYRSAMQLCHFRLLQAYQRLLHQQGEASTNNDDRDALIALWCLYLQTWVELGCSDTHEWVARIRTCPMVGNHPALTLWRARFRYQTQNKTDEARHELEQGILLAQQKQVPTPTETTATTFETTIRAWAQHDTGIAPLQPDPVSVTELEASLRAVWDLPLQSKPHAIQYYWYSYSTDVLEQPAWQQETDSEPPPAEAEEKVERNCERCSRVFTALQEEDVWCSTCRNPFHVRSK